MNKPLSIALTPCAYPFKLARNLAYFCGVRLSNKPMKNGSKRQLTAARRGYFACGFAIFAMGAMVACGGSTKRARRVSYSQTAKANYERGLKELKDDNHLEALKYFNFVKNKFPFSRFSTLAELGIADTLFDQEKHSLAIDAYKLFMKFHPTHPKVLDGYAAYRVCEGYVAQIPADWFLVPPSHEKDQSATREALAELTGFMRRHKQSSYLSKAKKLYDKTQRRLIDHELYVARFYLERDKPRATIMRLEGVLQRFSGSSATPQVMLLLGKTYLKVKEPMKAKKTFHSLIHKYPKNANAVTARSLLARLGDR